MEKISSWGMGQNALGQWDCRVFKLTIFPEQYNQIARFFTFWYKFWKIKGRFFGYVGQKWVCSWDSEICCISVINRWNELIFWVDLVKNGHGPKDYGTLKSSLSQEWIE